MTVVARVEQPTFVEGASVLVPVSVSLLSTGDCGRAPKDLTGATAVSLVLETLGGSAFVSLGVSSPPDDTGLLQFMWTSVSAPAKFNTELRYTLAGEDVRLVAGRVATVAALP